MQEPLPHHFKVPQLESYGGMVDLVDHLKSFKAMMLLHGATDVILCRAFPSTLKGQLGTGILLGSRLQSTSSSN